VSDLFGLAGRRWLEEVGPPAYERETASGCLRQLDFCEAEIAEIEPVVAAEALASNARMISMLTATARLLRRTPESIATPCSVNTEGA
jgi:hypothetical protein